MIWAKVCFRFEGVHQWPGAPDGPEEFLRDRHRHEFHCTVWVEQRHDDRDIEFIRLKRFLQKQFPGGHMGPKSCEMMATEIIDAVRSLCGDDRAVKCEVMEDGENGALVE